MNRALLLAALAISLAALYISRAGLSEPTPMVCLNPDGGFEEFGIAFGLGYNQGFAEAAIHCMAAGSQ